MKAVMLGTDAQPETPTEPVIARRQLSRGMMVDMVLLGLIGLIVLGAALLHSLAGPEPAVRSSATPVPTPTSAARMGQTAGAPGYQLAVHGIRVDTAGQKPLVPGAGKEFYIVDIAVKNTGTAPFTLASGVQAFVRDGEGNNYKAAPAPLEGALEEGALAPGVEHRGEIGYVIPQTAQGLKLYFDPGNGASTLSIELNH